ncbi:GntP family permease [Rhodohalobacter sp. SW132]|uniref:GntP family permease n=1 Tax=Rhodohalobacter sp. SW132 TaxID=2293433 RepID=UPI000E273F50|nr:GntP family permease [Rhodohalobacter sp. SW132]REL39094.1 GntP family permease [Rhodohalobacter sp. SW132]
MIIFFWLLLVVAAIVWMTARWKVHPFLALIFGAIGIGFLARLDTETLIGSLAGGFGSTLQSIGIVIAAGAIIGEYLDRSGGARVLANKILNKSGEKFAPLSMSLTGYIVSIPVFCDSGFIVLSALNKAIAKRTKISLTVLAVALASGLYATHVFVPPTPGPLAAAATLNADIGLVLILGLIVSIPVMAAALAWAVLFCNYENTDTDSYQASKTPDYPLPSFKVAIAPILTPIILIALKSIAEYPTAPFGDGWVFSASVFLGDPIIALLIGVGMAFLMVTGGRKKIQNEWLEDGLKKAGIIILITGAGGAFGQVLRETDLGEFASQFAAIGGLGVLVPFLIAAFLKTAQGSSTVAIITAAAICAPLIEPLGLDSSMGTALAVLAIGAGSLTVSHLNDSYFWVVAKFSDMETSTALKTHTIATLIMGITGLITIQIMVWVLV